MSKRARGKASTARSVPSETPNLRLQLPTELVYDILASALGDYLGDLILNPVDLSWDAILSFIHVSRNFRGCTIKLLYHLWGNTFINERTRAISNYKPTLSIFTRLAKLAEESPSAFTQAQKPRLLSERVVRHPLSPLARLWSCLIRNTANANACISHDLEDDNFVTVFAVADFQTMENSFNEIPEGVRAMLLGRVMHHIHQRSAVWFKLNAMNLSIHNVFQMIFMMAFSVVTWQIFQVEFHSSLQSDTDIANQSRLLHERVAAVYGLAADEIPALTPSEMRAVGFDEAVGMLSVIEGEGDERAPLCKALRVTLATQLTEGERRRFMQPWAAEGLSFFPPPGDSPEPEAGANAEDQVEISR